MDVESERRDDHSSIDTGSSAIDSSRAPAPTATSTRHRRPTLARAASSSRSFMMATSGRFSLGGGGGGYEADERDNWAGALTLLDVFETFFDSRIDLLERQLRHHSSRLKNAATELIPKGLRTPRQLATLLPGDSRRDTLVDGEELDEDEGGEVKKARRYRRDVEREVEKMRLRLSGKVADFSSRWRSAQIVRTREKISFLFGVLSLVFTCLVVAHSPEWIPLAYTVQSLFYLPTRVWDYKRKAYHYFLFDLCYFVNIMDLIYLWIFPANAYFFITCWCLTLGPIASAIITWRNSLVFHSMDKVTSLFIHLYPPTVFIIIQHFAVDREIRYPAVVKAKEFSWWSMILLSAVPYIFWQGMYWKFVLVDRREKIESGQRMTSFRFMLNDKRGPVGKALQGIKPAYREASFMGGQLIYSVICMLPAVTFLRWSPTSCIVFLLFVFSVSAWNGASYYVEVFGRKFERELERLRKEVEASASASASQHSQSAPDSPSVMTPGMHDGYETPGESLAASPLTLEPRSLEGETSIEKEVDELDLDKSAESSNLNGNGGERESRKER